MAENNNEKKVIDVDVIAPKVQMNLWRPKILRNLKIYISS